MANSFSTSSLIAEQMTEFFEQGNPLINTANRNYVETYENKTYSTGSTIEIKIPGTPPVQTGLVVTASPIQDLVVPYTITTNDIYNVTRALDVYEEKLFVRGGANALTKNQKKAIVDNYAYPGYLRLAGALETRAAHLLKTAAFYSPIDTVDKLGGINSYPSISQIDTMMNLLRFDPSTRCLAMNEFDAQKTADSLQNMFNAGINKNITVNARPGGVSKYGRLANLEVYRSTAFLKHTAGPLALQSGITVQSVSVDGTQITLTGVPATTSKLINAGDRISIPSVFMLSNVTGDEIPYRLVVTAVADANGNGSGQVTVTLSFPLLASGEHAIVSSLPSIGAEAIVFPDYNLNFAYVPSGLSVVPLELPDIRGAENETVRGETTGIPVKTTLQGKADEGSNIFRIWMLVGIKAFAKYIVAVPSLAA